MSRYIDVDKLLVDKNMHTLPNGNGPASGRVVVFIDDIENAPTVDAHKLIHQLKERYQGFCEALDIVEDIILLEENKNA